MSKQCHSFPKLFKWAKNLLSLDVEFRLRLVFGKDLSQFVHQIQRQIQNTFKLDFLIGLFAQAYYSGPHLL